MPHALAVVVGLAALVIGAEVLLRGGQALAARAHIPPIIVGLTVVSIGTSLPELAVGIDAAIRDAGPLAVGNIAGTNIVNLLLILGLSAAFVPLAIDRATLRTDLPAIVVSAAVLWLLAANGTLSRLDGALLLALGVGYTLLLVRRVRRNPRQRPRPDPESAQETARPPAQAQPPVPELTHDEPATASPSLMLAVGQLVVGIAIVILGAEWLVTGSVELATDFGVPQEVIGLTIIAIGTSAPELVTTIVSTVRGNRDIAIGNLIGSSIYNVTVILGITALVVPLRVTSELIRFDIPLMLAATLILVPAFVTGRRVNRGEGIALVAAYLAYLAFVIVVRA